MQILCDHPDLWALLADHPELASNAVEETMRHSPVAFGALRTAVDDVEVAGIFIPAGSQLVASGIGASHQKARDEHAQLVSAETITVIFSADQVREQVVGQ